jgi:hypothetical protein
MKADIFTDFLIPTSKTATSRTETTFSRDGFLNLVVTKKGSIDLTLGRPRLGIVHLPRLKILSLRWAWERTQQGELGMWMVQWRACPKFGAKDRLMRMDDTVTDDD